VPYFAAALARTDKGWVGEELDLSEAEDLDAVTDLLRQVGSEQAAPVLLFVEEDDEWFGVVRVDGDGDPRVFVSDSRVVDRSDIARMLYEEAALEEEVVDDEEASDDEEEEAIRPEGEPAGDTDLLSDLGTPSIQLLELSAEEGMLPADVISVLCERAGCLDQLEELRI
jgi:putative tRNA adenosine deaminase-associated protein